MATRTVAKYLASDSTVIPVGTFVAAGVDLDGNLAVWVEHMLPMTSAQMRFYTVATDTEFGSTGTFLATVLHDGVELHVYDGGRL